jgi:hypothetical protein
MKIHLRTLGVLYSVVGGLDCRVAVKACRSEGVVRTAHRTRFKPTSHLAAHDCGQSKPPVLT